MTPTGEKSMQVHGKCVRKMFLKATPASEVEVIEDVAKIRKLLHSWQERIIRPEYVLMAPVEEGDAHAKRKTEGDRKNPVAPVIVMFMRPP